MDESKDSYKTKVKSVDHISAKDINFNPISYRNHRYTTTTGVDRNRHKRTKGPLNVLKLGIEEVKKPLMKERRNVHEKDTSGSERFCLYVKLQFNWHAGLESM